MKVVMTPENVDVGLVVQLVAPPVPVMVQVIGPAGAVAPVDPVTDAVKIKFPGSEPVPLPVSTFNTGAFWIVTLTGGPVSDE